MELLAEEQLCCPADSRFKEAVTQFEVTSSSFKVDCARISCAIVTLKQSFKEASHLLVSQMHAADILNKHVNTDKLPNKYKLLGKYIDITSTAMVPISTVKRKKGR